MRPEAAGLTKKEIKIDDHNIVYLEGGKGPTIYYCTAIQEAKTTG